MSLVLRTPNYLTISYHSIRQESYLDVTREENIVTTWEAYRHKYNSIASMNRRPEIPDNPYDKDETLVHSDSNELSIDESTAVQVLRHRMISTDSIDYGYGNYAGGGMMVAPLLIKNHIPFNSS